MSRKPKKTICRNFVLLTILIVIGAINSIACSREEKAEKVDAELTAPEEAPEEDSKATETEAAQESESEAESTDKGGDLIDGMRPEFKQAMDSYEEFMKEYCDFMEKYSKSDGTDVELLADYADYMSKYADVAEDFEAWDGGEMNSAEAAYYLDVQTRINKKLLKSME